MGLALLDRFTDALWGEELYLAQLGEQLRTKLETSSQAD